MIKVAAVFLLPFYVSAQITNNESSLHLLANTNPGANTEFAQACFEKAPPSGQRFENLKRDQALQKCLDELLKKQDEKVGAQDCRLLTKGISDQTVQASYQTRCYDLYGYEDCKAEAANDKLLAKCIKQHYGTISMERCQSEVKMLNERGKVKLDVKICEKPSSPLPPSVKPANKKDKGSSR